MSNEDYLAKISKERKQFLCDIANDEWVDRIDEASKRDPAKFEAMSEKMRLARDTFLATTTNAFELHCFAEHWNWGGGNEAMRTVAEHPHCDAATALLIFWRSDPQYYLQYPSRDNVPDYLQDGFDLAWLIEERYLRGDYAIGNLSFDPRKDVRIAEPVPGQRILSARMMLAVPSESG
jgi:Domain of unknown function (DUF4274)